MWKSIANDHVFWKMGNINFFIHKAAEILSQKNLTDVLA